VELKFFGASYITKEVKTEYLRLNILKRKSKGQQQPHTKTYTKYQKELQVKECIE